MSCHLPPLSAFILQERVRQGGQRPEMQEGRLAMSGNVELRIDRGKQLYPRFAVMWKPGEFTEESSVFYKPRWRREASSPEFQQKYWRTKTTVRRGCPIFPSRCSCSPWLPSPQSRSSGGIQQHIWNLKKVKKFSFILHYVLFIGVVGLLGWKLAKSNFTFQIW